MLNILQYKSLHVYSSVYSEVKSLETIEVQFPYYIAVHMSQFAVTLIFFSSVQLCIYIHTYIPMDGWMDVSLSSFILNFWTYFFYEG